MTSEPPPIKGGGEPWLWPWPDRRPVRVDRSRLHLRRCSWCGNDVPELAWRGDSAGEHIVYVADPNGISMEIVHEHGWSLDGKVRFRATEKVRLALCKDVITKPREGGHAIDVGGTVHGESFAHAWPDWTTTVPTGRMVQATGRTRVPAFLRRLMERLFAS